MKRLAAGILAVFLLSSAAGAAFMTLNTWRFPATPSKIKVQFLPLLQIPHTLRQ